MRRGEASGDEQGQRGGTDLGTLSNDNCDGNEDGKNRQGQIGKTTTLPSLHVYDVKLPSFTFYAGREHKTTIFLLFCEVRYTVKTRN